jgi:hypothetical protein
MRLRRRRGFDEHLYELAAERMSRALAAGMDEDTAVALAGEVFSEALHESVPRVTAELIRTTPRMLRWHRRHQRAFERRLRKHWGKALDLYFSVAVSAEEAGATFDSTQAWRSRASGFRIRSAERPARTSLPDSVRSPLPVV